MDAGFQHASQIFLITLTLSAPGSLLVRPGCLDPNPLVAMDFSNEGFTVPIQRVKESVVAAVAAVHAHTVETDAELALVADALQGEGRFGEKLPLVLRDAGFFTARWIVAPSLGKVEIRKDFWKNDVALEYRKILLAGADPAAAHITRHDKKHATQRRTRRLNRMMAMAIDGK